MSGGRARPTRPLARYLAGHGEPEAGPAAALEGKWGHALVVPAYGEEASLFPLLGSVPAGSRGEVLIAVVLNARADSPARIHAANEAVRARILRELPDFAALSEPPLPPIRAHRLPAGTLLVIDRAAPGHFLPQGQGVGLARKIGNDAVLALMDAGRVESPWLHNTDADVILPRDYFDQVRAVSATPGARPPEGSAAEAPAQNPPSRIGAAVYAFDHRLDPDPVLAEAARLYEISLRYYVLGLAWAGSPYAYQSMGSCLAIPAESYAAVRGFPRKNAAEDFYVLDKLAKVGEIVRLDGSRLLLEGRPSDRVPFGTGRALLDLIGKKGRSGGLAGFRLFHPLVFAHLAQWIDVLAAVAGSGGSLEAGLAALPSGSPFFRADLLEEALRKLGAFEAIPEAIAATKHRSALVRRLHTWFDSFRTLKLIHALRDAGFPSIDWRQALTEAPFTNLVSATDEDAESLRRKLARAESKLAATRTGVPTLVVS